VTDAVEEDEIAGTQRTERHRAPAVELRKRVVGQRDAEVREHEPREPAAVEAAARARPAPGVRDAEEPPRVPDDARLLAPRACERPCKAGSRTDFQAVKEPVGLKLAVDEHVGSPRRSAMVTRRAGHRGRREHEHEQDEQWQETGAAQWRGLLRVRRSVGGEHAATAGGLPMSADEDRNGLPQMGQFHRLSPCFRF